MRPNPVRAPLLAAFAALVLAGCAGSGGDKAGGQRESKPTVLTLANGNGNPLELEPFAAAVRQRSGGTLKIEFKSDWRAGETDYESKLIRDVKAGKADLGWAAPRAFDDAGVSAFDALNAPLLIDSLPLERAVLESPVVPAMLARLKPAGLVGLGILPGPLRRPLGVARLVRPQDYSGATIALQRSQIGEQTLEALGARGAPIAAQGEVAGYDGVEQQISSIAGNRYDTAASHLTANVALWPRALVLFANPKALSRLDARQRAALTGAASAAVAPTFAFEQRDEAESAAILCRRGVRFETARPADVVVLRRAVQPVYRRLEQNPDTKAAIAQITAMRGDDSPSGPTCSSSAGAQQAAGAATPVDGVYRADVTMAELKRGPGFDDGEANPSNVGHFKFELRNGRFRMSGASDGTEVIGNYTVKGDDFAFSFNGEGPYRYRWSLYRGALTLRKRGSGPTGLVVQPWRRVAGGASIGAPTPLDGIWVMTSTRAEAAKHTTPGDLVSENYGRLRFVMSRGQVYYTQAAEGHQRWTRARYSVKGHMFTFTVTDYGGDAPHGASEKTGEEFSFRWSRYRDRMTLAPVPGAISPENFRINPWRRVGDAP